MKTYRALVWLANGGALLLASCEPYTPGALMSGHRSPWSQARQLECVDVAIEIMNDARVGKHLANPSNPSSNGGAALLDITLGNRCDVPVWVDLSKLSLEGNWPENKTEALELYDPRHEINRRLLPPRVKAHEGIEIDPVAPHERPPSRICVQVASIVDTVDPHRIAPPLCFNAARKGWIATNDTSDEVSP
ncbi:MAG: hypothetical protein U0165_02615 [Polyangiaceae bacterium]